MKNILKTVFAVTAIALAVTSCKKQNEGNEPAKGLQLNSAKATVTPVTSDTIYGHWGNPRGGNFGSIYVNLSQSTSLDTASSNNARFDIVLTSTNNSFVQGVNGYTVEYVQGPTFTFSSINSLTTGTLATSIGRNTAVSPAAANGWYSYIPPGGNTLENNFFIIARSNDARPDYALKFTSIVPQGTATLNRGKYIIQYGEIL